MKDLTERQKQILEFIQRKRESDGFTPTFREIAAHFGFSSPNAALCHVQALLAKGVLKNLPGRARALKVVNPDAPNDRLRPRVVSVPIYGSIPAGPPEDAKELAAGFHR